MSAKQRTSSEYRNDGSGHDTDASEPKAVADVGRTYCVMAMPTAGCTAAAAVPVPVRQVRSRPSRAAKASSVRGGIRAAGGLLLTAVIMASPIWLTSEPLLPMMKQLSAASAHIPLPQGGQAAGSVSSADVVEWQPPSATDAAVTTTSSSAVSTTATTDATQTTAAAENTDGLLPVTEQKLGNSGTKVSDSVYVKNSTGYSPDFGELLDGSAKCKIKLNAGYQVLIVHTHTTECYAQRSDGLYSPDYSPRTTDQSQSVVAVGNVLAEKLEAAGIRTLHAVEVHDYPRYNGSYDRALDTIEKYLEENPSIEMVIDVHRDAITYDSGAKLKPTAVIDGNKAAQVMIITGCDAGGSLYFPGWKQNLCMALQLQKAAQELYPGLMRPLNFAPYRYNMHMTPNSLLLEFGTDVNTLEEALRSAELMGDALVEVLLQYVVG